MEEKRVVGSSILDQPVHGSQDVLLERLAHGVLLVVGEDDHVLSLVTELLHQVRRHVAHIVDTTPQLAALTKVVDAYEKGFPPAVALRVLEVVAWGFRAERQGLLRWRARSIVVAVKVRVRICGGDICAKRHWSDACRLWVV